jgi:hypothetical protein
VPTYRPDVEAVTDPAPGTRSVPVLLPNEARVTCPSCGSPYIATFAPEDPRGADLPGFVCTAGDCPSTLLDNPGGVGGAVKR